MNKKLIEYLIVATAIAILLCSGYSIMDYKYGDSGTQISDSIFLNHPSSSEYKIVGDTIEFKNPYDFYNMNVSKLNSTDQRLSNLLNHFSKVNEGKIDYKNESCYLITI